MASKKSGSPRESAPVPVEYEIPPEESAGIEPVAEAEEKGSLTLASASALLMELPDDSGIKKGIERFLAALQEDHKHNGQVGTAALQILNAAANPSDSAYQKITVSERAVAVTMASALRAAFQ